MVPCSRFSFSLSCGGRAGHGLCLGRAAFAQSLVQGNCIPYSVVCWLFRCLSRPERFVVARFLKRFCTQHLCLKGLTVVAQLETLFCLSPLFLQVRRRKNVEVVLWRRTWFLHCVLCFASAGNAKASERQRNLTTRQFESSNRICVAN